MAGNACCEFLSSILNSTLSAFCPMPDSFPWTASSPRTRGKYLCPSSKWVGSVPLHPPSKDRRYHQPIHSTTSSSCIQNWQTPRSFQFFYEGPFVIFSSTQLYHPIHHSHTFIMVGHMQISADRLNYFCNNLSVITPRSFIGDSFALLN